MGTLILSKVHNFGIYRKGGKRCILQLDFPSRLLLIIQKGRIKKSQSLDSLQHFDSEDGLGVSLKFEHKDIDFEADSADDKYTICRLLGCVLQMVHGGDEDSIDSGHGLSSLGHEQIHRTHVIKEGLLEKKGSSAITTWNKRKIRLMPGQFSYYKPGEKLALNIVQLWHDNWEVKKLGQNGFTVTIRDRIYSFRIPSEYKGQHMLEIVRCEWILAFQQAFNEATPAMKMFDQPQDGGTSDDPEHIYDVTPDMADMFSMTSAHDRMQLPVASNKMFLAPSHSAGEITAHVTVHLNYIDKGGALPRTTMDIPQNSEKTMPYTQDNRLLQVEPSSPQPPSSNDRDPFCGGSAAALREKLAKQGGKSSSLKAYRAQEDFQQQSGALVMKSSLSQDSTLQIRQQAMPNDDNRLSYKVVSEASSPGKGSNHPVQEVHHCSATSSPGVYRQEQKGKKRMTVMPPPPLPPPPLPLSPQRPLPQPPSVHFGNAPGAPPLPPLCPPPVPPLSKSHQSHPVSNCKLKQVHWVKVNSNQITSSLWRNARDLTDKLDLAELEDQFSIQSQKTIAAKPKLQEDKEMLIDSKRAQNLGILFCGLRAENVNKLTLALNSTMEVDSFPMDKMATFKRYQPTSDDREIYKVCSHRRDSLHQVDLFMLELCAIPYLSLRLDLTLTLWEFPHHYASVEEEVSDLLSGCEEILTSRELPIVLEFLLAIGNYMNSVWSNKQGIQGFQMSSVEKVLGVKGRDPQMTLCTYLVKQIKKTQPELINWTKGLGHVSKCAGYSIKAVGAEIDVLKNDLQKMKKILKTLRGSSGLEDKMDRKFETDTQSFIVEYDLKLEQLDVKYTKVMDKYKQLMVRFGEPCNKSNESFFSHMSLLMETFQQTVHKLQQ